MLGVKASVSPASDRLQQEEGPQERRDKAARLQGGVRAAGERSPRRGPGRAEPGAQAGPSFWSARGPWRSWGGKG